MTEKTYRIKPLQWMDETTLSEATRGLRRYVAYVLPCAIFKLQFDKDRKPKYAWEIEVAGSFLGHYETELAAKQHAEQHWREYIARALDEVKP